MKDEASHPSDYPKIIIEIIETGRREIWEVPVQSIRYGGNCNASIVAHDESKPTRTVFVSVRSTGKAGRA
jgi:hypothetical protein